MPNIGSRTLVTDSEIQPDDELLIRPADGPTKKTTVGEFVEHHDESHVGKFSITGLTFVTNSSPSSAGQINFAVNALVNTKGLITYKYADVAARDTMKAKIVVGKRFELKVSDTVKLEGVVASTPVSLFGRLSFNLNEVTTVGTLTNNASVSVILDSKIPARDQIIDAAFKDEPTNLQGGSGTEGQVWTRGSSDSNAAWAAAAADGVPDAPANASEAKTYELSVPASSGAATWAEAASGGGGGLGTLLYSGDNIGSSAVTVASNLTSTDVIRFILWNVSGNNFNLKEFESTVVPVALMQVSGSNYIEIGNTETRLRFNINSALSTLTVRRESGSRLYVRVYKL